VLQLRARTTAAVSPHFTQDRIWLNGVYVVSSITYFYSQVAAITVFASSFINILHALQSTIMSSLLVCNVPYCKLVVILVHWDCCRKSRTVVVFALTLVCVAVVLQLLVLQ